MRCARELAGWYLVRTGRLPRSAQSKVILLNHRPVGNYSILRHDDDAIANVIERMIHALGLARRRDRDVVPDAGVLVDNGIFDPSVLSHTDAWPAHDLIIQNRGVGLVVIAPEQDDTVQIAARPHDAADADNGMTDVRVVDNAAVRNNRVVDVRAIDLRAGQPARARKNWRAHIKKVEARQFRSHIEIRIEE